MNISFKVPSVKCSRVYWSVPRFWPRRKPLLNLDDHEPFKVRWMGEDYWLTMRSGSYDHWVERGSITLRITEEKPQEK